MSKPIRSPAFSFAFLAIVVVLAWLAILLLTSASTSVAAVGPSGFFMPAASEEEPNNTPDQANTIPLNENMTGRIPLTDTADIDYFVLTTEIGGYYEVRLDEQPSSGNYKLNLSLYDSSKVRKSQEATDGGDAVLNWTADDMTYYFSVDALEIVTEDANYILRVVLLGVTPPASDWDSCEINDSLTGTWSATAPPGGPCSMAVGQLISDLNFAPYTGQPAPNPDYFQVWLKSGRKYSLQTTVSPGVDTELFLYAPGATDDSQFIARNDDKSPSDDGSLIEYTPGSDGNYIIRVINRAPLPHESSETYNLTVQNITATATPSLTPGIPTATSTPIGIPGTPDAFEPNWDFDVASLIGLGIKYANLNFVPWGGQGVDNDFYKLWVTSGKLYTCETLDLGDATNTNMILYSCPSQECGFAGNDDIVPFDPNDPYRSRITFFSSYTGYLYILLGQVGADRILPAEWAKLSYSLHCYIDLPGTATPTPTSEYAPPPPQLTPTPQLTSPPPIPTSTPLVLLVIPMTTPEPLPPPPLAVTSTPQVYVIEVVVFYDRDGNGRLDPGEGIVDVLARAFDAITGDLLSIDYTDEMGFIRFMLPSSRPVRVSVPFFGFDQIVTATSTRIQIRISPLP
jgi:hypothetical protein